MLQSQRFAVTTVSLHPGLHSLFFCPPMLPTHVSLVEVGPRDGLQNEAQPVAAAHKIELVHRLQAAGCREVEVTSFVSPKWVPQMADNTQVMAGVQRRDGNNCHHDNCRMSAAAKVNP